MNILFYDTETTGFPIWKESNRSPNQPYIVQLAAVLANEKGDVLQSIDLIINNQVEIPDVVADIHGISTAMATEQGILPSTALNAFIQLWRKSELRVGHNERFDSKLIAIAIARIKAKHEDPIHNEWRSGKSLCTMNAANPHTKKIGTLIPPQKWPRLEEAMMMLMGKKLENAHSAMPDVLGCMELYYHLMELEKNKDERAEA